jgi:transcriptional regulator with PAS, ATPase and Fis domain
MYKGKEMKKSHCQALEKIKGSSQQILRIKAQIQKIAAHARLPVLITGETGTGKELVANALHACSDRHANPLVKINCSAIPENLFESYFFGHKKGAFTGATEDQDGVVKAADQGMLFLDEVSEMPINQQAKLLRFLENQIYSRVGEQTQHQTDIWIVAASNRQSKELRFGKNFRSDLYYRLCGATITLPSLCNRKQDIKTLAYEFAQQACGHSHIKISPKVIDIFYHYSWPGNIRELKHIVEHSCLILFLSFNSDLIKQKFNNQGGQDAILYRTPSVLLRH